tara:strand:+ start:960 stop:1682 length:723 start_codon:yes stop_codon:yes gene_type:complete
MKLILENWRGYLAENEDNEIEAVGDQVFTHLIKKLQQTEIEQPETKEEIDEAVGVAIAGLALAAPQILEIVGEAINWAAKKGREMRTDPGASQGWAPEAWHTSQGVQGYKGGTAFGNKLLDISKKWHHLYVNPIEKALCGLVASMDAIPVAHSRGAAEFGAGKFMEAQNKQDCDMHDTANKIFHLIVAAFLFAAGHGALKALKAAYVTASSGAIAMGTLEAAMAAVKSNELWEFIAGGLH